MRWVACLEGAPAVPTRQQASTAAEAGFGDPATLERGAAQAWPNTRAKRGKRVVPGADVETVALEQRDSWLWLGERGAEEAEYGEE